MLTGRVVVTPSLRDHTRDMFIVAVDGLYQSGRGPGAELAKTLLADVYNGMLPAVPEAVAPRYVWAALAALRADVLTVIDGAADVLRPNGCYLSPAAARKIAGGGDDGDDDGDSGADVDPDTQDAGLDDPMTPGL